MGIQLQQLDIWNIKMKLFFVLALFIASCFAENSATCSFTGPAELVKHIAEHDDKGARACVAVKAPKAKTTSQSTSHNSESTAPQSMFPPKPQPSSQKLSNQKFTSFHPQSSSANCDVTIV